MTSRFAFPSEHCPLRILQDNWEIIAEEAAALDVTRVLDIDRVGKTYEQVAHDLIASGEVGWMESWGPNKENWLSWGIVVDDMFPLGDVMLPKTCALLSRIGGFRAVGLSMFRPGHFLPSHTHPHLAEFGMLSYHLGLDVPPDCYINVDGEFMREENGKAVVFDGALPHYAYNASPKNRMLLYAEFSPSRLVAK